MTAKRRKKVILKKMQQLLGCSPLSSEPALLGWSYTKKGTGARVLQRQWGGGPHHFSLSINHLPHRHASMRCCEWTHAAPLLQRERENKEEAMGRERRNSKEKEIGKRKKETDFSFLDIVIHKLYCPYY
jgi:hypothetical protein